MRSKWKGSFVKLGLLKKLKMRATFIYARNAVVTSNFLSRRVNIYNGKRFISVLVKPEMIGFKFGAFALTKSLGAVIHRTAKSKKKKKK